MSSYKAAIIGTGPDPDNKQSGTSFSRGYGHAEHYEQLDETELVACADIVEENALAFADRFNLDKSKVFKDYEAMLDAVEPDIVSVCTPIPVHAELVIGCAESGVVEGIHCEKPMADDWGDCKRMAAAAEEAGVQLTFHLQRRFHTAWREAKRRVNEGEIGELQRIEMRSSNYLDNGIHYLDLCQFFNDNIPPEWVMGQIDYHDENIRYGTHCVNSSVAQWQYENGLYALGVFGRGKKMVESSTHLVGTEGVIDVKRGDRYWVRYRHDESLKETEMIETDERGGGARLMQQVVDCLSTDETPEIAAEYVLQAMGIIFGVFESSRRRGLVEYPLEIEDSPLLEMYESGELPPGRKEK